MSSSLTLSKRLRALDDQQLQQLLSWRLSSVSGLKDYFDVADALLGDESLQRALQRIPVTLLQELREISHTPRPASAELSELLNSELLGDEETVVYPEVALAVNNLPEIPTTAVPISPVLQVSPVKASAAIEQSLAIVSSLEDVIASVESHPVKQLARGGLSAQDQQRLSLLLPPQVSNPLSLLALSNKAGLLALVSNMWIPGHEVATWQQTPLAGKWISMASGWSTSLSPQLREALHANSDWGHPLTNWVAATYPLGHQWLDSEMQAAVEHAHLLGLEVQGIVTEIGRAVVSGDFAAAEKAVTALIPPYATQVFVQHDFTVIAPSPLTPEDEQFMRQLCVVESRGIASTYRITTHGVNALLSQGFSAAEIVKRLGALAATDIPQAVSYFITDLGERFGSITVSQSASGAVVTAIDPLVLRTIAADRALTALSLRRGDENTLVCTHSAEVVLNALLEAKYSAQLVDKAGNIVSSGPVRTPPEILPDTPSATTSLIERLRGSREAGTTDDATWIARQLDLAVRNKSILIVSVSMPDGEREFTIEPKGFSNGRLRCLDRTTEVERTLPASHITSVRLA